MLIKNAKRWAPYSSDGYWVALIAFVIAFSVRYVLHDYLGPLMPFVTFLIAVLLIEYRYGMGPSITLAAVSIPVGMYFFVPPYNALSLEDTQTTDLLLTFGDAATMGLGIALIESLQRSRYEARLLAEVARTRYEVLLRSEGERQSAVASARQTREHFRTFASTVGDVLYMKRVGGGFEYVSDVLAEMSGVAADKLTGGQWLTIMHPEDAAAVGEQMEQALESRQTVLSEFRLRTAAGDYAQFEGKVSAMEDERGLMVRWTGGLRAPDAEPLSQSDQP